MLGLTDQGDGQTKSDVDHEESASAVHELGGDTRRDYSMWRFSWYGHERRGEERCQLYARVRCRFICIDPGFVHTSSKTEPHDKILEDHDVAVNAGECPICAMHGYASS
jgi:hypothetical protein